MGLSRQQIDQLLKAVSLTRSHEISCDECLQDLAEFAESRLSGKSVRESLEAVEHHLVICEECREEYNALLVALQHT